MRPLPSTPRPSPAVRRSWLLGALVTASLALAGCDDITGLSSRDGAPDQFRFSTGGFGTPSRSWEVRGDTLVFTRVGWDPRDEPPVHVRTVPTAEDWRGFWLAVEGAGVPRWRERYVAEDVVDGGGWHIRLRDGGLRVESFGSNAYPDRWGHERELEMPDEFGAFLTALGEMVGGAEELAGGAG